ncbi:hypothetical protein C1T31_13515 [Hanstruepera neustonica]|uniref:Uncharacterized protein n=1 Tax=Hanstruepera neustonica TaxID=1445657 RepID=A0A2K1DVS1_9FLAO|nr:hypothetical protein [Hanstruepera neustonica]PNQ72117.1 hypothetical protein C1T31_13515 [Hanstruepera neustonica]
MAKLKSFIKIEGTLDDLTFYKGKEGYLVKTKSAISANRIKNDPAFIRTRENGAEFGHAATSGKQLRRAILNLLTDAKDDLVTPRLTQTMTRVKDADTTSPRGERNVATGLTTAAGRLTLNGFNFNVNAILSSVLLTDFTLNTATGEIDIPDFVPSQNLTSPEGATHVSLEAGFLNLDFATNVKDLQLSPIFNTPINNTLTPVVLTPAAVPAGAGNQLYFLKVAFFQEVNGIQYALNNGTYNALQLIDIL